MNFFSPRENRRPDSSHCRSESIWEEVVMVSDAARVKSIFLAAIERYPAEQWPAYLDGSCEGDDELRDRVQRLLEAHGDQKSLHIPSPSQAEGTDHRPTAEHPGDAIGPYKLREQIGE